MSDHNAGARPNPLLADPLCARCGGLCWTDEATAICRDCRGAARLADCAGHPIASSAKVVAYDLLNHGAGTVGERKLFALVDAVACVLAHGGRYGGQETARLALESLVGSAVALAAVRALVEDG